MDGNSGQMHQSPLDQSMALVTGDGGQFKHLTRILRRVVGDVLEVNSLRELPSSESLSLITVSYDELNVQEKDHLIGQYAYQKERPTLILLSEGSAQRDLAGLFGAHILTNLLVFNNSYVDIVDLLVTVQKILLRDIFGLEKYFSWGIRPFNIRLTSSTERRAALDEIDQYAQNIGIPKRLIALIHSATDEFITNAIYNAPTDKNGASRYGNLSRTEPVELLPGEEVNLKFCCDGRRFGVATIDPFGSLSPQRLHEYLARCFRKGSDQIDVDPGGAGIGFYQIFDALSHFVVNISPGSRTEMIGLIDVSGSYKDFVMSGKSFNIFVSE